MRNTALLPALAVWEWPQGIAWLWVVAAGCLGTGGHMLWTRALKLGDVSALTPISFMQLPVVALAGYLLFGEIRMNRGEAKRRADIDDSASSVPIHSAAPTR